MNRSLFSGMLIKIKLLTRRKITFHNNTSKTLKKIMRNQKIYLIEVNKNSLSDFFTTAKDKLTLHEKSGISQNYLLLWCVLYWSM